MPPITLPSIEGKEQDNTLIYRKKPTLELKHHTEEIFICIHEIEKIMAWISIKSLFFIRNIISQKQELFFLGEVGLGVRKRRVPIVKLCIRINIFCWKSQCFNLLPVHNCQPFQKSRAHCLGHDNQHFSVVARHHCHMHPQVFESLQPMFVHVP